MDNSLAVLIITIIALLIGVFIGYFYANHKNKKQLVPSSSKQKIVSDEEKAASDLNQDTQRLRQSIERRIEQLKEKVEMDFIGLAFYDFINNEIRWRLAAGATNNRYKKIVIRLGKGIAGEVVQLNRTIKIENYPYDVIGDPIEYPILLVEYLKSAIAVPIVDDMRIYGVLLAGKREHHIFHEEEEQEMKEVAKKLASELAIANVYTQLSSNKALHSQEHTVHIHDSIFVQHMLKTKEYLHGKKRGILTFEVLDQSIIEIPEAIQRSLMENMDNLLQKINQKEDDQVNVSISREESNLLIEATSNRSLPPENEVFTEIYQRLGEIGGSAISYHEDDHMHFIMQIPLWSIQNHGLW